MFLNFVPEMLHEIHRNKMRKHKGPFFVSQNNSHNDPGSKIMKVFFIGKKIVYNFISKNIKKYL